MGLTPVSLCRLASTAATTSVPSAKPPAVPAVSYRARYDALAADGSGSPLSSVQFHDVLAALKQYDDLLKAYSVKQDEMERARRAAAVCGLSMDVKGGTKKPNVIGQRASQPTP